MPSPAFQASLPFILRWEGGFVDDPDDPGGRTNRGITQKTYDAWRARRGLRPRNVKRISNDEVAAIYEVDYWAPPRCDLLARPLDLAQFDTAVNMGVRRSIRILQTALSCDVDGAFGPTTAAAAVACDVGATFATYCRIREGVYHSLVEKNPKLAKFLTGWLNRLNALLKEAGLPGFESVRDIDPAEVGPIARIADLRKGEALEAWK
jgi:lysozyme family protein